MKQEEGRLQEEDLRLKARPEDSAGCRKYSRNILPVQEAQPGDFTGYRRQNSDDETGAVLLFSAFPSQIGHTESVHTGI